MSKFKVGDKVKIRKDIKGSHNDLHFAADMKRFMGDSFVIEKFGYRDFAEYSNWTWHDDWLELVQEQPIYTVAAGFADTIDWAALYAKCFTHGSVIIKKKTLIQKMNNYAKKLLDPKTKALLEAGFIDSDLRPTRKGLDAMVEIQWFGAQDALVKAAEEQIAADKEARKNE